jgi:putative phosphoesterase
MKIGVLSDTHLSDPHSEFKKAIETYFRDVEKILHAGDFVDMSVAEYLSSLKELIAVCGNMDPPEIRKAFPRKRIIELAGFRIGLVHGGGPPFGMESRVRDEFDDVNAIVYGHTHTHGIYIRKGSRSGTFLPQVAQETGWTKEEFLGHCSQDKAGIGWNGWKDAELYVYEALVFGEK